MAGSWQHITDEDGRLDLKAGLIENLGDAAEALEQCYDMVQYLAQMLENQGYREHGHGDGRMLTQQEIIAEAEEFHYKIHRGEVPDPVWHGEADHAR